MRTLILIAYGLWCAMIVLAAATAARDGASPFADGGRSAFVYAGGGGGGPRHK